MNLASRLEIFSWKPASWLRVTGSDAATFLQGQFTNDLSDLETASRYGLWLNVKGKVIADSFVLGSGNSEDYWIGSYASPAPIIVERLESHVIADDVTIYDQSSTWAGLTVFGAGASARVAQARTSIADGFAFPGRRCAMEHMEWVFPAAQAQEAQSRLGEATILEAAEVSRRRIEARIPLVPADIGPGDLPNEGGLDVDAVSYTKGCYLGQEVMARLKSMGQVRRRLLSVSGAAGPVPTLPVALFAGGRQVGELRSVASTAEGLVGLAMLSLLHLKAGMPLTIGAEHGPELRLTDPI